MKSRLILASIMALVTIPAFSTRGCPDLLKANNPLYNGEISTVTLNGKTYKIGEIHNVPVSTRVEDEIPDVITNAEGETKYYNKISSGTFVFNDEMYQYVETFPGVAVWGEDNTVYLQDILSTVATGNYVKGVVDGDKITCKANQILEFYPEEGYGITLVVLTTDIKDDVVDFYYDPSITEFEYLLDDNGNMTLSLPGGQFDGETPPEYVIGICYSDEPDKFLGFSDYIQEWNFSDTSIVELPENATVEEYVFIDEWDYAKLVEVAYVDDSLYIRGFLNVPKAITIKATVEGDKAYVAQNQCLGIYYDQYYLYTKVMYDNPDFDEDKEWNEDNLPYLWAPPSAVFPLDIDRENKIISANEDHVYLSFQPDEESYDNIAMILGKFTLKYQGTANGTPSNPTGLRYETRWMEYQGFNDFFFNLTNYSTEGNLLDDETLFYRIFIDGEELIFEEEVGWDLLDREVIMYQYVPGQQRYMNSLFDNNKDITRVLGNEYDIGIYVDGVSAIGVQSVYFHDNTLTFSDIVTLDVETGEITTESVVETITLSPVKKVEYFDLSGKKVSQPGKGIFIVKELREDGKITTRKIAR
ncbi:MAG: hypothetical protein J1F67_03810 [Muribaculaceae bacterium]|nr:hypothetical protein [Muribaculaceae bacterium]